MYAAAAVIQSFRQSEFRVRLRIDEGPFEELALTTLIVHNNQYVGQFRLFPEASLSDGRLNLLYGLLNPANQLFEDLGVLTQTYFFARAGLVSTPGSSWVLLSSGCFIPCTSAPGPPATRPVRPACARAPTC